MLVIDWKGKVGYGDIVSPICYAHNIANKLDAEVKLVFHWPGGPERKISPKDPETLHYRADYVKSLCVKTHVTMEHRFNTSLPRGFNHTNYDFTDDLHNFWYSAEINTGANSNKIVVNGTHHNEMTLKEYGKSWKDPVGADGWKRLIDRLSTKYEVIDVSYRTPVAELVGHLTTAHAFIGYHGTAAWMAKFVGCPMIVLSDNTHLTQTSFGGAAVKSKLEDDFVDNLDTYVRHSCNRTINLRRRYLLYRPPPTLVKEFKWT